MQDGILLSTTLWTLLWSVPSADLCIWSDFYCYVSGWRFTWHSCENRL